MSVTVPVSVAVSMSVLVTVAEFVCMSMSSVHDRLHFSVHAWAGCPSVSYRVRVCSCRLVSVAEFL